MSTNRRTPVSYRCSFCGKSRQQVRRLIAGPGAVYICDECVDLCREIIEEERSSLTQPHDDTSTAPTPSLEEGLREFGVRAFFMGLPTASGPTQTDMPSPTNVEVIRAWEASGDRVRDFDDQGDGARRWLLNPTIFELLGEPKGKRILDAGCGQGYLCRLLAKRGARVTGVEPALPWYAAAVAQEEAEPQGIEYMQADLSTLALTHPHLQGTFQVVIANMVLIDIPDYIAAICSCAAALVPGGVFLCTLLHPCFEESSVSWPEKRSVETREYFDHIVREQRIGYLFHRPLSSYINALLDAGFTLRRMVEPRVSAEGADLLGNDRDRYIPSYVALSLTKG